MTFINRMLNHEFTLKTWEWMIDMKTKCKYCNGTGILSCQTSIATIVMGKCEYCKKHWSDCAVHNEPATPNGKCDCGGYRG